MLPVELWCSLLICAWPRAVLLVPICLAVFRVILFPQQSNAKMSHPTSNKRTQKHSCRQAVAFTCYSSHTSCSDSVPDSFLSLPLEPAPPFLRPDPGRRPLKMNKWKKCNTKLHTVSMFFFSTIFFFLILNDEHLVKRLIHLISV